MPPRRSTRSSTRLSTEPDSNPQGQKQAPSSKRKRSTVDNADIDEQEDHGKPPSRAARRPSTKGEPSRRTKRSRQSHQLQDVHEESEEEDTKPTANGKDAHAEDEPDERVSAKPTSRSAAVAVKAEHPDEPDVLAEESTPVPSPKLPSNTMVVKAERPDEPDLLAEESTPVPSPAKLPSDTLPVYEEKSLLDNLPTSPSKTKRPPLPLEDLQGPRPRLVIHKLVLVNFKSYAGCQEIGPFHRVGCFQCRNIKFISCSLSQRSSDLMVQASQILSMRCFLCSGTVPARCDKENFPNLYTTLRNIRICRIAV